MLNFASGSAPDFSSAPSVGGLAGLGAAGGLLGQTFGKGGLLGGSSGGSRDMELFKLFSGLGGQQGNDKNLAMSLLGSLGKSAPLPSNFDANIAPIQLPRR